MTVSPSPTSSAARRPIRSRSSIRAFARSSRLGWWPCAGADAPPCARAIKPSSAKASRSRRTVSVETLNRRASSLIRTCGRNFSSRRIWRRRSFFLKRALSFSFVCVFDNELSNQAFGDFVVFWTETQHSLLQRPRFGVRFPKSKEFNGLSERALHSVARLRTQAA